ncbi:MAG TPA: GNAT family N-acetyltransferase [Gammaproteobacteria bacterium]
MNIRNASEPDIPALARIWYDGWQDGHGKIVPAELARHRTLESFDERLRQALPRVRVAEAGVVLGFHIVQKDELYQFYVDAPARGTGLAAALIADAERALRENGVTTAWLVCAIGNSRAERFYEKQGWRRNGKVIHQTPITGGELPLEVWRYEKELTLEPSGF